jgi:hypothetical protein
MTKQAMFNIFEELKRLDLPAGQYVVVGSGTMAAKGIRESSDLDVMVTDELWNELIERYEVRSETGRSVIRLSDVVEIVCPVDSVFGNSEVVPIEEIFDKAERIQGYNFINLEHLIKIKAWMNREKDLKDIELIKNYLNQ